MKTDYENRKRNLNVIEKDRKAAKFAEFENSIYKKTILKLEQEIENKDIEIKELTKKIHDPTHHSSGDLKNFRINRRKLKKHRENLKLKLDLMRK